MLSQRAGWILLAGLLPLLIAQARPIFDPDLFWQVALGRRIIATGALVATDPFTFTVEGKACPQIYLLSQLVYAICHDAGGWALVHAVDSLAFAMAFVLAGWTVRHQVRPLLIAGSILLATTPAVAHSSVRPQTFGLLGFSILLLLWWRCRCPWQAFGWGLVTTIVWQNFHPSASLAVLLLPLGCLGWLFERRLRSLSGCADDDGTMTPRWDVTLTLGLAALLGLFATPDGWRFLETGRRNAELAYRLEAKEWFSAFSKLNDDVAVPYFVFLAFFFTALLVTRPRLNLVTVGWILGMLALSLAMMRFALFALIAMIPVLAVALERRMPAGLFCPGSKSAPAPTAENRTLLVGIMAAILLMAMREWQGQRHLDDTLPISAVSVLQGELTQGRVYCFQPWGGPLLAAKPGQWRVYLDGRIFLFPDYLWDEYRDARQGLLSAKDLVTRYRLDAFFLHPIAQQALVNELRQLPTWREIHADATAVVFVRREVP